MSREQIALIITLAVFVVAGIATIIVALVRGKITKFVKEKMAEAEERFKELPKPERSVKKLEYVVNAVKEEYKLAELFINIKKLVEELVRFFNSMNGK